MLPLGTPLCKSIDSTPQHRFDSPGRNVAESIISMCLDFTGFTKDKMNAREDLAALCDRPSLKAKANSREHLSRPWAPYCLKPTERKEILKWLKTLKFPDRYAANIK